MTADGGGALQGLTVIDLTRGLAGPFCTQLLADHGARVIKIEPFVGDSTRRNGPFRPDDKERAFAGYYQSINRNKLGMALDLKHAEGQAILKRFAGQADVLVENYRPGVMERFGLAYETLHELNPRLVYGAIRGFGDPRTGKSPYVGWPAYDVVSQAMGGMMGITGPDAATPLKVGPGVGDIVPAIMAGFGILAAVLRARETGRGQFVDVGMVDVILAICERIVYQHSYGGEVPHPEGTRHPLLSPFGLFPARDGWVAIACSADHFWRRLCEVMERPDLGEDPRLATNLDRVRHRDEVYAAVGEFTSRHTKQELIERLGEKVPFGPVFDVEDIFADEHFRARRMLEGVDLPGLAEPVTMVGTPIHMSETPGEIRQRGPRLGEHTDAIMREFGFSDREISAYRAADVVR